MSALVGDIFQRLDTAAVRRREDRLRRKIFSTSFGRLALPLMLGGFSLFFSRKVALHACGVLNSFSD